MFTTGGCEMKKWAKWIGVALLVCFLVGVLKGTFSSSDTAKSDSSLKEKVREVEKKLEDEKEKLKLEKRLAEAEAERKRLEATPEASSPPVAEAAPRPRTEKKSRAPSTPKVGETSKRAIDGVVEAGEEGRPASVTAKVAVGTAAKLAEAGHEAEERAKFETVVTNLAPEELQIRKDKLERVAEEAQRIRDNIKDSKKRLANAMKSRDSIARSHMRAQVKGGNAGINSVRREDIKAKDEAVQVLEAQLEELQTKLREVELTASKLDQSIRSETKKFHSFEE